MSIHQTTQELITRADSTASISERMEHFHVPGVSVALINQGKLEWNRAWGQADSKSNLPLTSSHLLYACSMAKFITAMTAVALAQAGEIDLDADVNDLLTSWHCPHQGNKVSLRLLLSHQAGIIDGEDCFLPLEGHDYPSLVQVLEGVTPVNTKALSIEKEPGTAFAYSDNGYCLVQQVLEDVTGRQLAELTAKYVFIPLAMKDSIIADPPLELEGQVSSGHEPDGTVTPGRYPIYPFPAAAGLWCTPGDLAIALIEVQDALKGRGRVLSSEAANEMFTTPLSYVGLGCFREGEDSDRHIYHLGWGQGFQCAFVSWPWQGRGAVIMTNSQPGMTQSQSIVGEIVRGLAREYNWGPITDMLV